VKKILIATAMGTAMLGPVAASAADTKVYGKFNIGLDHQKDEIGIDFAPGGGTAAPSWWRLRDNNNSSRLGFKGSEDLGLGDLKAIYQLEYGVDPVGQEGATFSQRNIYVGLTGGFGTVKFGNYDTSVMEIGAAIDEFNDTPGDITLLMAGETRTKELIQYATPKFADAIQAVLTVQPGDHRAKADDAGTENGIANTIYAAVTYSSPMLDAGIGYAKDQPQSVNGLRFDSATAFGAPVGDQTIGMNILRATAQGKFAGLEVGGLYQTAKGIDNSAMATAATGGDAKENSFLLSAGYTLDAFKLKAQAGQTKGDATNDKRKEYAVGADYKLSKAMYTSLNLIRFDHTDGAAVAGPKLKTDTVNVSLTYSF